MCLVKTLLGKTIWDKNLVKEKEYIILYNIVLCIFYFSPSCKLTSLRWRSPILWTNCSKVLLGKDLVNKSTRFSHERIFWISTSPFLWRSWVKKNFGRICFVRSPLIYSSFNWVMHALCLHISLLVSFFPRINHKFVEHVEL